MSIINEAHHEAHHDAPEPKTQPVAEEEALLQQVHQTLRQTPEPRQREDYAAELIKLRDSLGEARLA
ncbi:MAG: hypothetical protein AAFS10_16950, partial [Myxococcota bacterium]